MEQPVEEGAPRPQEQPISSSPWTASAPGVAAQGEHRRWTVWLLVAVALMVAVGLGLSSWRRHQRAEQGELAAQAVEAAVPVQTVKVQQQTMPLAVSGMGNVLPVASVTVRTRVDGQLDQVDFKEGQDVAAGQVLARLDPRTLQAQLLQAQAQKARDEAQLTNARADLQRYQALIQQDATTRQTLDTQQALVRQLEATVQTDAAAVNAAQVQLGFTTIKAPLSGRVGARLVDPGNIVNTTDTGGLVVINQIDPIAVQFTLPESSFQAVNRALHGGQALVVQAQDPGTQEVLGNGQLTLLNNQIDTSTGTITLKAHFANPAHRLWPGQAVQARLVLGQQPDALVVPSSAVQRGQNGLFAYVVDAQGKARVQAIQVASSEGGRSVVSHGLSAGERVVSDGQYRLQPGAAVVESAASGAPADPAAPAAGSGSRS